MLSKLFVGYKEFMSGLHGAYIGICVFSDIGTVYVGSMKDVCRAYGAFVGYMVLSLGVWGLFGIWGLTIDLGIRIRCGCSGRLSWEV